MVDWKTEDDEECDDILLGLSSFMGLTVGFSYNRRRQISQCSALQSHRTTIMRRQFEVARWTMQVSFGRALITVIAASYVSSI